MGSPQNARCIWKGKWRIVFDYRKLYELTTDDKYSLPNISDLHYQLGKCQYFSTINLASDFRQIETNTEYTEDSLSVRIPFSLKKAPPTFKRLSDNICLGIQNERLLYMNYIIIYFLTIHENVIRLAEVFKPFRKRNLIIQPDLMYIFFEKKYLEDLNTKKCVKSNTVKVEWIQNFPDTKIPKEIKI